jgi:hypothetical protein
MLLQVTLQDAGHLQFLAPPPAGSAGLRTAVCASGRGLANADVARLSGQLAAGLVAALCRAEAEVAAQAGAEAGAGRMGSGRGEGGEAAGAGGGGRGGEGVAARARPTAAQLRAACEGPLEGTQLRYALAARD